MEEMTRLQLAQNAELARAQRDLLSAKATVKTTKKELKASTTSIPSWSPLK
jgi:hypothetical protein